MPNAFFTEVLPRLAARPPDLVVAVYAFHAIARRRGSPRYVSGSELAADEPLRAAVAAALHLPASDTEMVQAAIEASLAALVREGFLHRLALDGGRDAAFFLPMPADRRAMRRLALRAPAALAQGARAERHMAAAPEAGRVDIVAWYEATIGTVPPLLVDELREAEAQYPEEWIEEAFREAAALNHRSWRYVRRILERWDEEGRDHAKAERDPLAAQRERYLGFQRRRPGG